MEEIAPPIIRDFLGDDYYTAEQTDEAIETATEGKADTTYVNTELAKKADKTDTYTKAQVDNALNNKMDKDNPTGTGKIAVGQGVVASGAGSQAFGVSSTASGLFSHAEGFATTASGESSHAEGYLTTASGRFSHAEGSLTIASGRFPVLSYGPQFDAILSHAYIPGIKHIPRIITIAIVLFSKFFTSLVNISNIFFIAQKTPLYYKKFSLILYNGILIMSSFSFY